MGLDLTASSPGIQYLDRDPSHGRDHRPEGTMTRGPHSVWIIPALATLALVQASCGRFVRGSDLPVVSAKEDRSLFSCGALSLYLLSRIEGAPIDLTAIDARL